MMNIPKDLLLPRCLGCDRDFVVDKVQEALEGILEVSYQSHIDMIVEARIRLKKYPGNN
jgi:hypothetical protein